MQEKEGETNRRSESSMVYSENEAYPVVCSATMEIDKELDKLN
jgi:hypothetical protein